jgi:hypothetical protein
MFKARFLVLLPTYRLWLGVNWKCDDDVEGVRRVEEGEEEEAGRLDRRDDASRCVVSPDADADFGRRFGVG